jgi:hypothetical protein
MISMTLDKVAVEAALVTHLKNTLKIDVEGKTFDVDIVAGRKTKTNANPSLSATINIFEAGEAVGKAPVESLPIAEEVPEPSEPVEEELPEAEEVPEEAPQAVEEEPETHVEAEQAETVQEAPKKKSLFPSSN